MVSKQEANGAAQVSQGQQSDGDKGNTSVCVCVGGEIGWIKCLLFQENEDSWISDAF